MMKNANGMGSVYQLQGNRRRPWVVCVTLSIKKMKNDCGYIQKRKMIGYYETKEEALFSLWNYNHDPILFRRLHKEGTISFAKMYEEWSEIHFRNLSKNAINGYKAAYAKCVCLHNKKISSLRTRHFQEILNESYLSLASDLKLKSLMVLVCEYALQNDIIHKNYARYIKLDYRKQPITNIHKPFTDKEIECLFQYDFLPFVDTILIMIYTGMRIGELLNLPTKNVDIQNMTLRGGAKSEAGKNRIIPIHERIQTYIIQYYKDDMPYLIHDEKGVRMSYHTYRKLYFDQIMKHLHMDHLPHDCRHTFATRLNNEGANTTAIKKMIGHSSFVTTEKIYSHKDLCQLRRAISLLK